MSIEGRKVILARNREEVAVLETGELIGELFGRLRLIVIQPVEHPPVGGGRTDEPALCGARRFDRTAPQVFLRDLVGCGQIAEVEIREGRQPFPQRRGIGEQLDATGAVLEGLDLGSFDDASVNGLQLEAGGEVRRLAVAVDASLDAVQGAGAAVEVEGGGPVRVGHGEVEVTVIVDIVRIRWTRFICTATVLIYTITADLCRVRIDRRIAIIAVAHVFGNAVTVIVDSVTALEIGELTPVVATRATWVIGEVDQLVTVGVVVTVLVLGSPPSRGDFFVHLTYFEKIVRRQLREVFARDNAVARQRVGQPLLHEHGVDQGDGLVQTEGLSTDDRHASVQGFIGDDHLGVVDQSQSQVEPTFHAA